MPWYKVGKVNVVSGQSSVMGVGTDFAANSLVGDAFIGPDGQWYEVINVPSPTTLSISPAYRSATVSNANYALMPVQGYQRDLAIVAGGIIQQWGATLAGLGTVSTENIVPVTKGGTGAATSAAARSNLGLGSAAVAPIVGTVTQSGGVPNGAIIERGSNANGSFTRYADGTLECWHTTNPVTHAAGAEVITPWTLPSAPVLNSDAITLVSVSAPNSTQNYTNTKLAAVIASASTVTVRSIFSAAQGYSFSLYFKGRWF
ncbi:MULTISPECIES: phage tail protein [unclassified Pseudomonas]|uniref:phage tail protein n=1 Tax=unclassified Pseudomonas TaxID=196821 RepID=UPI001463FBA1|nr:MULTISPECIES: phage tail protein [unclassified Pseudomonas]QJI21395.1 phage tail protein [Pseudomonas sp. ADAK21]QJI23452.1 phage tail protein [Pseudomonas sp. ADAK20]